MDTEHPTSAHASASKRKRDALDTTAYNENGEDENTPKRRRSPLPQSDIDADVSDEATATYQKNVRRKKGSRNLSNLNLRHAAEMQKGKTATVKSRKSKFLEGSLTDKPSEKPPSMFTRFVRTDSGNIKQVAREDLMEEYHHDNNTPRGSIEKVIAQEKAAIPNRVAQIADKENKSEGGMFGKWASSLHPVALWNKVFAQTREEIIREDFEEAERKAGVKAAYEAQYAEMKKAGMFKPKPIGNYFGSISSRTTTITHAPRDSGIVLDDESDRKESDDHQRSASHMSGVLPIPQDDTNSASEAPETSSQPSKTLKSRLHLKKPSLTNIQGSLKRVRSDFSLAQTLHHRESSSSISPVKTDFDDSALKKSHSKYDLKKQHKLSKRVSDLESKLSLARKELDDALVEASPMPKIGSRYERFTPQSTLKRPKFMPGKLPSLPSERILMAQQQEQKESEKVRADELDGDAEPNNDADLEEFLAEAQGTNNNPEGDEEGEETIKARAPHSRRQYPARASSLFSIDNTNIEQQATDSTELAQPANPTSATWKDLEIADLEDRASSRPDEMDPNSITSNGTVEQVTAKPADYSALDAKLKALDANVKLAAKAKRAAKSKKRKSSGDEMDKNFKPEKGTEDDTEWDEEQTPKKKRKSTGAPSSSPNNNKRALKAVPASSPKNKKTKKKSSLNKGEKKDAVVEIAHLEEEYSADEGADLVNGEVDMPSARSSFESQTRPLEPVFEDEEEDEMVGNTTTASISIPLNDEPSKPTAKATPARHAALAVNGHRSRSTSPNKRPAAGAEEQVITRASVAAKSHPRRARGRSTSPLPGLMGKATNGYAIAGAEEDDEPVRIVPGEAGVPAMPNGNGSIKGKKEGKKNGAGEFEWPDDVF